MAIGDSSESLQSERSSEWERPLQSGMNRSGTQVRKARQERQRQLLHG